MAKQKKRSRKMWSPKEVSILRSGAGKKSVERLARQLKRTVLALRFKAFTLGLSLSTKSKGATKSLRKKVARQRAA